MSRLFTWAAAAVLLAILSPAVDLSPQNSLSESVPWGTISPEELALKDNPSLPGSAAMILDREVATDDAKRTESNYYRVKIFTDEGKKYADQKIFYFEKEYEVQDIRARTIHADGKAVDFDGQVFDTVLVKARKLKYQAKAFSLPNVTPGSILEYSYTLHWRQKPPDILKNPEGYMITHSFTVPTVRWITQEEIFTRRAHFSLRPFPKPNLRWSSRGLPEPAVPHWASGGTVELDIENIPPYQEEEFMPPENAVKPRVDFYYVFGFASPQYFWTDSGNLRAEAFEKFIGKPKDLEREVAQIVAPNDTPEVKARKIYARVQQVRSLGYERAMTEQERKREDLRENKNARDALEHNYAVGNQVNLVFVALARAAGLDAAPVLVAGRNQDFFVSTDLDDRQLDAMVVLVRISGKELFLDPATHLCPFDLLPWEESGTYGIRASLSASHMVKTPAPRSSDAVTTRTGTLQLDTAGNLSGNVQVIWAGQKALELRLDLLQEDPAGKREALEKLLKDWLPEASSVELSYAPDWEKIESPLRAEFSIKVPGAATVAGHRLLLAPAVFQSKKSPFQSSQRIHTVYFHYPYQEIDQLEYRLPAGYQLEGLVQPARISTQFGTYAISSQFQADTVRFERRFIFEMIWVDTRGYFALRNFFASAKEGDQRQVILRTGELGSRNPPGT